MSKPLSPMLTSALRYGAKGWKLFPILDGTKDTPLIRQWGVNASSDTKQISEWWTRWPNANIGLACMPSGIAVIDSDNKPGGNGEDTLGRLEFEGRTLTPTQTQRTPSGGIHRLYKGAIATTAGKIGPFIDTRGTGSTNGGYILLPPSRTPKGAYKWTINADMAPVDQWAVDACGDTEQADAAPQVALTEWDLPVNIDRARDYLKTAPVSKQGAGGGDILVKTIAPRLKDMAISEQMAVDILTEPNGWNSRCEPPWGLGDDVAAADDLAVKVHNSYLYCVQNPPGIDTADADFTDIEPDAVDAAEQERIRKRNEERKDEVAKKRPTVTLANSFLPQAIAKVERILLDEAKEVINGPDRIFQRDGKLVRLSRNILPPGVEYDKQFREQNALLIVEVSPKWLANRLDRSIQFVGAPAGKPKDLKPNEKPKKVPKNASAELCARMIEDSTRWRHPYLFGTIEAPTLRRDGSVLTAQGYDPGTGLFFDPGETTFPRIPEKPQKVEGRIAMRLIESLLVDFPFTDAKGYEGVSKAVALAAILTGIVRRSLPIAPGFAITATEAETGKTELTKVITGITIGREISGQPFSAEEEERRKAIGGNLRSGRPILFFDNVDDTTVEGSFLEQIITLPSVTDRILGMTEDYTAATNTLLLFNGNNITIGGAMTTRIVLSRIVAPDKLANRKFAYPNLFDFVIENRPRLVASVLTALRAFQVANPPPDPKRGTSRFPEWDRMIAQALVWYGYADPARGGDELRELDPVKEAKRDVVRKMQQKFGDRLTTSVELAAQVEIRQAIAAARGKGTKERDITPMVAGLFLKTLDNVKLDLDWVLSAVRTIGHPVKWRLEYIGKEPQPSRDTPTDDDGDELG